MADFQNYKSGYVYGTGAVVNISLGWIPDKVTVTNLTDADRIDEGFLGRVMPYTSGGVTEVKAGMIIKGATSGAIATILQVLKTSGTWAGGDAAGSFIIDLKSKVGTFASELIYIISDTATGVDDATVTVDVDFSIATVLAVAVQAANGITSYLGSTTAGSEAAEGFTLGTTTSESGKLLFWEAFRSE